MCMFHHIQMFLHQLRLRQPVCVESLPTLALFQTSYFTNFVSNQLSLRLALSQTSFVSDQLCLRLASSQTRFIPDQLHLRLASSQTSFISDQLHLRLASSQTSFVPDQLRPRLTSSQTSLVSDQLSLRLRLGLSQTSLVSDQVCPRLASSQTSFISDCPSVWEVFLHQLHPRLDVELTIYDSSYLISMYISTLTHCTKLCELICQCLQILPIPILLKQ